MVWAGLMGSPLFEGLPVTILHAYRRTAPCSVDLTGGPFKFAANEHGHFVCDVPEGPALTRLLEIGEAYRVYGAAVEQAPAEDDDTPLSKYVITNGDDDSTVDLRTLDRTALLAFIADQDLDYKPHHKAGEDTIRDKIVELLIGG